MSRSRITALVLAAVLCAFGAVGAEARVGGKLVLHWVDGGITPTGRPPLDDAAVREHVGGQPLFDVASDAWIVVRMPKTVAGKGKERWKTQAEWDEYEKTLTRDLLGRIRAARANGIDEIEIRTVQDINFAGHTGWNRGRRQEVVRFTKAFLRALHAARAELAKDTVVEVDGSLGSNGVKAGALALLELAREGVRLIDALVIYDGRAKASEVRRVIDLLRGRVTIVNTSQDAPSSPLALPDCYVATHRCAKKLREEFRGEYDIQVFLTDPIAPAIHNHLRMMRRGDATARIKSVRRGNDYRDHGSMTQTGFQKRIRDWLASVRSESSSTSSDEASDTDFREDDESDDPDVYGHDGGDGGGGPPPPPPGGGAAVHAAGAAIGGRRSHRDGIGGVWLGGAARAAVDAGDGEISSRTVGGFSLLLNDREGRLDRTDLARFVTALWAVYFSDEGPGLSIDPIGPGIDRHLVRYIGHVVNSDLARVMRETDYKMKQWAVGTSHPGVEGFRSIDEISGRKEPRHLGAGRRFWLVPRDLAFRATEDAILFEDGRMTVQTEFLPGTGAPRGAAASADREYARFFTEHYDEIAAEHPEFWELREYAKLVALARHLKEEGVPLLWFLLTNQGLVSTEDSPGTVEALAKSSAYVENIRIEGGVELAVPRSGWRWVADADAEAAFAAARRGSRVTAGDSRPDLIRTSTDRSVRVAPSAEASLSFDDAYGEKFQTDLSLRRGSEPGLELVRYYAPELETIGTFGEGWHLMVPYRLRPGGHGRVEYAGASLPETMALHDLLTGDTITLAFDENRYAVAGYLPSDPERRSIIGVFPMTDGSFRLADKLGSEFHFDPSGDLTRMILGGGYVVSFEYDTLAVAWSGDAPTRLEPQGSRTVAAGGALFPDHLRLRGPDGRVQETFAYDASKDALTVRYLPQRNDGLYEQITVMTDGSFRLAEQDRTTSTFDAAGRFQGKQARVIRRMTQGDQVVVFTYSDGATGPRIARARLTAGETSAELVYGYGSNGRLARIVREDGSESTIAYEGHEVLLAMR